MIKPYYLLICSIFVSSCSTQEQSYFPLTEGYKWRYDVSKITLDGLEKQKYILSNLGESSLDDKVVYLRHSIEGTHLYYTEDDKGISYLGHRPASGISPSFVSDHQVVMPFPVSDKPEWEQLTTTRLLKKTGPPQKTEFRITAEVPLEVKIESMNESVSVPAGVFNHCLKITMRGSTYKDAGNYVGLTLVNVEQSNWYAKGVGLVKMERVETTKSEALEKGTLLVELSEFSSN